MVIITILILCIKLYRNTLQTHKKRKGTYVVGKHVHFTILILFLLHFSFLKKKRQKGNSKTVVTTFWCQPLQFIGCYIISIEDHCITLLTVANANRGYELAGLPLCANATLVPARAERKLKVL